MNHSMTSVQSNPEAFFQKLALSSILLLLIFTPDSINAQDSLKNLPELSMPLMDKKLVIAHCMTGIIRYQNHGFEDGCNPEFYAPTGNASAAIGGYTQVNVMSDRFYKDSSLDQAVEFEMRTALRCGVDGFQFYYPTGQSSWDNIIKAYFRVAAEKNINFKFTLCFSHPSGGNEDSKIALYANRINNIMRVPHFQAGGTNNYCFR